MVEPLMFSDIQKLHNFTSSIDRMYFGDESLSATEVDATLSQPFPLRKAKPLVLKLNFSSHKC